MMVGITLLILTSSLLNFQSASALTLVATISGQYGSPAGDTPNLFIHNPTAFAFTNVKITGVAYQGTNALLPVGTSTNDGFNPVQVRTQIRTLPDVLPGTDSTFSFLEGPHICNNLPGNYFANDYDDSYGCSGAAQPGNVQFTFTATWNGQPISAVFSPTTNDAGHFVGFLGTDQNGFAETSFDNGGAASGVGAFGLLANIFIGCPAGTHEDPTTHECIINSTPVGGMIIPVDMTALFVAGVMSNAFWMLPSVGAAATGIGIALFKKNKN